MVRKISKFLAKNILTIFLGCLLVIPVLVLLCNWISDFGNSAVSGLFKKDNLILIGKSFLLSGTASLLATSLGSVCGFILNKYTFAFKGFYKLVLLIPLLIPDYVYAVAWKDAWQLLFGAGTNINSYTTVIFVHILVFSPIAMLITGSAISQVNRGIEEAGLLMISFRKMLLKILIPIIRPSFTISFLLILIFSLSDFSVPAFFGVRTFTTEIFTQFSAFYNYQAAMGQSVFLLLICMVLMFTESRYLSDAPFFAIDTKGSNPRLYNCDNLKFLLHSFFILLLLVAVILPVFILFLQSFSGSEFLLGKAWELVSPTFLQSSVLALSGAFIISVIGLWTSWLKEREKYKLPNTVLMILFIIPSTVLGIAIIGFFNKPVLNFIYTSSLMIIIGYVGRFAFISARITGNGIRQIPLSLEEAATVAGIGSLRKYLKITLPLLIPSLFASFVLVFILCFGELGTTIMVYPPGTELMPVKFFTISANAPQALTSSMSLINFGIIISFIGTFYIIGRKVFKRFSYE